ncbi:MAG: hypothetical protein JKY37_19770 [Nannocystaceae bacterium]|nr:hypothetical protein [Nannocystaceae bacterium]
MTTSARTLSPLHLFLPTLFVLATACGDDEAPSSSGDTGAATGGADETGETGAQSGLRFWSDVAPLYYDNCVTCHREGGVAPFALDNYADAVTWAAASEQAVSSKTMPPWLVTSDGSCGDFLNSKALSDEDIDTIVSWIGSEQAEGEPRDDLAVPDTGVLSGPTSYAAPEFVPEIVGGALAEFDEYRCFLLEPGMDRDTFLTGYEVVPGNEAIVHHVLGIVLDPEAEGEPGLTNRETVEAYDAESPDRAGWPCFDGAGPETDDKSIPVAWAPGQGVVDYPDGTGVAVAAGEMIVAQIHYNLADPANIGSSDQTTVNLRFEDEVEHPGVMLLPDLFLDTLYGSEPASLPHGEESVEYSWSIPLGFVFPEFGADSMKLYGVLPHMHDYGRRIDMRVSGPAGEVCAADVQAWDFNWQLMYFYDNPMTLTADQTITVTCTYNTLNASEPVTPGWGTQNEMCLMGLFLVPE